MSQALCPQSLCIIVAKSETQNRRKWHERMKRHDITVLVDPVDLRESEAKQQKYTVRSIHNCTAEARGNFVLSVAVS